MSRTEENNPLSEPALGGTDAVASGDQTLNRVVRSAHETVDRLAAKAAPVVGQVKDTVSHASDVVQRRAGEVAQLGDEWTATLRSTVRENPLTAIMLAAAVGAILARMSGPR